MRRVVVTVRRAGGDISDDLDGWATHPGLAVCFYPYLDLWLVVHVRSGSIICNFTDPESAAAAAADLSPLADWTLSAEEIAPQVTAEMLAIKRRSTCRLSPAATLADLDSVAS